MTVMKYKRQITPKMAVEFMNHTGERMWGWTLSSDGHDLYLSFPWLTNSEQAMDKVLDDFIPSQKPVLMPIKVWVCTGCDLAFQRDPEESHRMVPTCPKCGDRLDYFDEGGF